MYIYIKNMVCVRCIMAVKSVLETSEISFEDIELGRVNLISQLTAEQFSKLNSGLKYYELELMENKKKILVEKIKVAIIEMFHSSNGDILVKLSEHLSRSLQHDYTYLANIFSTEEGRTIEKFYILNKVKRVKELLIYEGLTIKDISYKLNYSSVSHLCLQFKKVTGTTPSVFKKLWESERESLINL